MATCTKETWTISEEFKGEAAIKDYHRTTLNARERRVKHPG
jgi:hypothetical protein